MTKVIDGAQKATERHEPPARGWLFALAMALAALAGFVDAIGYIHFHQLFVSFMSGNSTQAMVAAAQGDWSALGVLARTILLFVLGVTIGETVAAISSRWGRPLVLALETALLIVAFASHGPGGSEGWTVVHVGRGLAKAVRGRGPWLAVLPFVGLWIGLISGGLAGALTAERSLSLALLAAVGISFVFLLWTSVSAALDFEQEPG